MRGYDDVLVEDRLRDLASHLRGPARLKADLLTEARHALLDAAEAYRDGGLPAAEAERRAVAEFGTPAQLVPGYQAELAAGALRGLALRALAVGLVLTAAGDLTWHGSSWSEGPRPPEAYLLLSASVHWIWAAALVFAVAGLLLGVATARYGTPGLPRLGRVLGFGLTGALGLGAVAGAALFVWSIGLWEAALTWPPMIIGAVVAGAGWFSLGRAASSWLAAAR